MDHVDIKNLAIVFVMLIVIQIVFAGAVWMLDKAMPTKTDQSHPTGAKTGG